MAAPSTYQLQIRKGPDDPPVARTDTNALAWFAMFFFSLANFTSIQS
jgi:hypothetical protein